MQTGPERVSSSNLTTANNVIVKKANGNDNFLAAYSTYWFAPRLNLFLQRAIYQGVFSNSLPNSIENCLEIPIVSTRYNPIDSLLTIMREEELIFLCV